jgi:hybrid cluster-associated redox disulfide protein
MEKKTSFTKDTSISEVLQNCPGAVEYFNSRGLECYTCMGASEETIEEGAMMHGIDVLSLLDGIAALCQKGDA